MSAPVFLSHSSRDRAIAETLCAALESRGIPCWMASRDIGPGQNFQEAIVRALSGARVMVLIFSSHANGSDEVKKELALASQNRVTIVPARVEDVIPTEAFKYELATRQWIDIFADWEQAVGRLADHVRAILEGSPAPAPAPRLPTPRRRRTSLALAALALLILAGGGGYWALRGHEMSLAGKWVSGEITSPYGGEKYTLTFQFEQHGQMLSGAVREISVDGRGDRKSIEGGRLSGDQVSFYTEGQVMEGDTVHPYKEIYQGALDGGRLVLTRRNDVATGGEEEAITATRQ